MTNAPLAGCRVLVTRAPSQADELCRAIESAGGTAIRFPVLSIVRWTPREYDIVNHVTPPDIVIFVSANAVHFGLPFLENVDAEFAAIGPATARALAAAGRPAQLVPAIGADSESLLAEPSMADVRGKRILIVRGEDGRELLAETLRERGALVDYLPVYRRENYHHSEAAIEDIDRQFATGAIDVVSILSVETLRRLLQVLPTEARRRMLETPLVAPGDRVLKTVRTLVPGIPTIKAAGPRPADIVNALIDWRHSGQQS